MAEDNRVYAASTIRHRQTCALHDNERATVLLRNFRQKGH
jgi:hypothetical protein